MLFVQKVYLFAVMKLRDFTLWSPINNFLLLVRYLEAYESIYQVPLIVCHWYDFLIILALSGWNNLGLELLLLAVTICMHL